MEGIIQNYVKVLIIFSNTISTYVITHTVSILTTVKGEAFFKYIVLHIIAHTFF